MYLDSDGKWLNYKIKTHRNIMPLDFTVMEFLCVFILFG